MAFVYSLRLGGAIDISIDLCDKKLVPSSTEERQHLPSAILLPAAQKKRLKKKQQ
jgi:hypothetical protein